MQINGDHDLTVSKNGTFEFAPDFGNGSQYVVTVKSQPSGVSCSVHNATGTVTAKVTSVVVSCGTETHSIKTTVNGMEGGSSLVLRNNGADPLTIKDNGEVTFALPVVKGGGYNVTIATQPAGQNCSVTNGSGTAYTDVDTITVNCAPAPGGQGKINITAIRLTSMSLAWTKSACATCEYRVYYSRSQTNNLQTVADIERNGTPFGSYQAGIDNIEVTGLQAAANYYFNVIVKNSSGAKAAYTAVTAETYDASALTKVEFYDIYSYYCCMVGNCSINSPAAGHVGGVWNREARGIITFDTASLAGKVIGKAYVTLRINGLYGTPFDAGTLVVDVKKGCFKSDCLYNNQAPRMAVNALSAASFTPWAKYTTNDSSEFTEAGRNAINTNGKTQMRLRFNAMPSSPTYPDGDYIWFTGYKYTGKAKLTVFYYGTSAGGYILGSGKMTTKKIIVAIIALLLAIAAIVGINKLQKRREE